MKIIITGASGGIGLGVARYFLESNSEVFIGACCYKNQQAINTLASDFPNRVVPLVFDATDPLQVREAIHAFINKYNCIDVLINCIGFSVPPQHFIHGDSSVIRSLIERNLLAPMYCCQEALKHMTKNRAGRILNLSSISATRAMVGVAPYAASKAAMESLTKNIAMEYGRRGIYAHCLRLGLVDVGMSININQNIGLRVLPLRNVCHFINELINNDPNKYQNGDVIEYEADYVCDS